MSNYHSQPDNVKITTSDILEKTSFAFTIRIHRILGKHYGAAGDARKAAILALRLFRPDITFKQIGDLMGRHYSSIMNLNNIGSDLLFSDKEFKSKYNFLIQELESLRSNASHAA